MPLDMDVRPRSRGDNRALRREFRSRSPQECGAHADPDACGGVPRNLGKLGRPIAISLRPAPNQSRFPGLQRSHSQNLHFDQDQLPVRQRWGQPRLHCRALSEKREKWHTAIKESQKPHPVPARETQGQGAGAASSSPLCRYSIDPYTSP